MIDFDTITKLPNNVGDLGKLIVVKGFKKSNKSPNLVTLPASDVDQICWKFRPIGYLRYVKHWHNGQVLAETFLMVFVP